MRDSRQFQRVRGCDTGPRCSLEPKWLRTPRRRKTSPRPGRDSGSWPGIPGQGVLARGAHQVSRRVPGRAKFLVEFFDARQNSRRGCEGSWCSLKISGPGRRRSGQGDNAPWPWPDRSGQRQSVVSLAGPAVRPGAQCSVSLARPEVRPRPPRIATLSQHGNG